MKNAEKMQKVLGRVYHYSIIKPSYTFILVLVIPFLIAYLDCIYNMINLLWHRSPKLGWDEAVLVRSGHTSKKLVFNGDIYSIF